MGSGACWTHLARDLEPSCDVVLPDARGHGESSAPEHGYSYDDHARDVVGLVQRLGLERPLLVGHSMGGMTAALVASRHPGLLRGLVLVDPTFLSPARQREVHESDVVEQHRRALSRTTSELVTEARARHPRRSLELLELQARARSRTALGALAVLVPPNPDHREVMRAIDIPTLLVTGDAPVVTRTMADELCAANPRVRSVQIADAGHGLPFEQPERLFEVVSAFVHELS